MLRLVWNAVQFLTDMVEELSWWNIFKWVALLIVLGYNIFVDPILLITMQALTKNWK